MNRNKSLKKTITNSGRRSGKRSVRKNYSFQKLNIKSDNIPDDEFLKSVKNILFKSKNMNEVISEMRNLYINSIDNIKYEKYSKFFVPYNNMGGRSGGIIGYLSNNVNTVMKIHLLKKNELNNNPLARTSDIDKCFFINNKFTEVLMNLILNNIEYFANINSSDKMIVKKHILELYDYGFTDKIFYITMPLIGFDYIDQKTKKHKYLTNLKELFLHNHLPILSKAFIDGDLNTFKLYDTFLSNSLNGYILAIKILQKHFNYINTDTKLDNIFIKYEKNEDESLNPLREKGLLIDCVFLLTDLEKSIIEINDYKIVTDHNKLTKIYERLLNFVNRGFTYKVRHNCDFSKFNSICKGISIYDFDILIVIIDLYINLLRNIGNVFDYLPLTNNLINKSLNLDVYKFNILKNLLISESSKFTIFRNATYMGSVVKKYCILLNKL